MADYHRKERLELCLSLKNCVVGISTGTPASEAGYENLRESLLNDSELWDNLPEGIWTCRTGNELWGYIKERGSTYQERREFWRVEFDPLLSLLERPNRSPGTKAATDVLEQFDVPHLSTFWNKALQRAKSDPSGSITAARSLVESVCKHILETANVEYEAKSDVRQLYRLVTKHLDLAPDDHTEMAVKQVLQGCVSVVEGLATLRTVIGDAHGKGSLEALAEIHHAELAINLSGSLCVYLLTCQSALTNAATRNTDTIELHAPNLPSLPFDSEASAPHDDCQEEEQQCSACAIGLFEGQQCPYCGRFCP